MIGDRETANEPANWFARGLDLADRFEALAVWFETLDTGASVSAEEAAESIRAVLMKAFDPRDRTDAEAPIGYVLRGPRFDGGPANPGEYDAWKSDATPRPRCRSWLYPELEAAYGRCRRRVWHRGGHVSWTGSRWDQWRRTRRVLARIAGWAERETPRA